MKKKILKPLLAGAVSGLITVALTFASAALPTSETDARLGKYDIDTYLYPIWGGGAVYQENLVFYEDAEGKVGDNTLLFTPDSVISVRNFGLSTVYEEGRDYTITGNVIHRMESSRIPVMPRSAYCKADDHSTAPQLLDNPNGGALISDNTVMQKYYVSVSYLHSGNYGGKIPKSEIDKLPTVKKKLENKEPVTIAILGDSISAGYSASGLNDPSYNTKGQQITIKVNTAPFMPAWPKMMGAMLQKTYGYSDITVCNWGVGGTNTNSSCLGDMIERVVGSDPDLVIIGFGMNEFWAPANQHADRIEGVCNKIHEKCPDAGFVLLSSMQPNRIARDTSTFHFSQFEEAYYGIQQKRTDLEIAVAPLNSVYTYISDIKGDFSLVGGNNNHPNDFTVRLYAQTVLATLGAYLVPDILTDSLPDATVGAPYHETLSAWCGSGFVFSAEGLPDGLTLSEDGAVVGTPTVPGTFPVTIKATSEYGTSSVAFQLTVLDPNAEPPTEEPTEAAEEPTEEASMQGEETQSTGGCKSSLGVGSLAAVVTLGSGALMKNKKKKK